MRRSRKVILGLVFGSLLLLLVSGLPRFGLFAQVFSGKPELDRSKPVPPKTDVIKAWRQRQDAIKTFRFAWTEQQTHPKGWLSNPRFPQREWTMIPGLLTDRSYVMAKTLTVDGAKMRYSFELDRKEEADGVRVTSPTGANKGLGLRRHYSYVGVFDGQTGKTSLTALLNSPPAVLSQTMTNADGQNLDIRAMMMAFRPLDAMMGHPRLDRAVTNQVRTIYKGKSTFLLEEQADPSGWKMILRIEPERDFLVCQYLVVFEQKLIADIAMDYAEDKQWGWIPSGWQITQMLDDGSMRVLSEAKVTSYSINQPIKIEEFQ